MPACRTAQRGSSSKSSVASRYRMPTRSDRDSSSMTVKASRACFARTRAWEASSFLLCCMYSLKVDFLSPTVFSAVYLRQAPRSHIGLRRKGGREGGGWDSEREGGTSLQRQ